MDRAELDSESQAGLARLLDALRSDADLAARLRVAEKSAGSTREQYDDAGRRETAVARLPAARAEIAQGALDLAERLSGSERELTDTLADALVVPSDGAAQALRSGTPASDPAPVSVVGASVPIGVAAAGSAGAGSARKSEGSPTASGTSQGSRAPPTLGPGSR